MGLLRHQRSQYRNQFCGRNVIEPDNLGDVLVVGITGLRVTHGYRRRPRILTLYYPDHTTRTHRGVTMHIKDGQE